MADDSVQNLVYVESQCSAIDRLVSADIHVEIIPSTFPVQDFFLSLKMPKSLEKTRKRIAKKRNGNIVLHEFSRDTKKLHKAQVRDERLEKLAAARKKHDQPLSSRQPYLFPALLLRKPC